MSDPVVFSLIRPEAPRNHTLLIAIDDNRPARYVTMNFSLDRFTSDLSAYDRTPRITLKPNGGVDGNTPSFGTVETRDCIFNVTGGYLSGSPRDQDKSFSMNGPRLTGDDMRRMLFDFWSCKLIDRSFMIIRAESGDQDLGVLHYTHGPARTTRWLTLHLGRHSSLIDLE